MDKEKVLRILDRYLYKPRGYHFICYGGGSVKMVDKWSDSNSFKCRYQGDKNWITPACEKCKGLIRDDKELSSENEMQNYCMSKFAESIIQELSNEA